MSSTTSQFQLYQSKKRRQQLAMTKKKSSHTLKPAEFLIASLNSSLPVLVFSERLEHWGETVLKCIKV